MFQAKRSIVAFGIGVAITLLALDLWARYLWDQEVTAGQPVLLRPFGLPSAPSIPKSSEGLPRPWLPNLQDRGLSEWVLKPVGGSTTSLREFAGRVVFLNFWNTSCGPCMAEMPGIEALYNSLKGEPVAFLAVAPEKEEAVRVFLGHVPLHIPVYTAQTRPPDEFRPPGFPTTFILDRNGSAVVREVGGANWDDDRVRTYIRALATQ